MGMASGWYKREFDAVGIPFDKRGKLMDENLEILNRLWTEAKVDGKYMNHNISAAVMYPKPYQKPRMPILIGGYVDKVLQRAATAGDGWLTYFYRPADFKKSWDKIRGFAKEAGKDPDCAAQRLATSDHGRAVQATPCANEMMDWLNKEWDFPAHSDCSRESAIIGLGRRMRRAVARAFRRRRAEDHLRSLQVPDGSGRDHRARDHPSLEIRSDRHGRAARKTTP